MSMIERIIENTARLDRLESMNRQPKSTEELLPIERINHLEMEMAELRLAVLGCRRDKSNVGIRTGVSEDMW